MATALSIGLTAGFGLGLWLLLARVWGVTLFGASWLALVQVHGLLQLFGFAGLFVMGVALHAIPRFRGTAPARPLLVWTIYAATLAGLALRAIGQPWEDLPGRDVSLAASGALLTIGTSLLAATALRALSGGRNPHRADELLMGAGLCALPVAALLVALEMIGTAPVLVDQVADDRGLWVMLLGGLATSIVGVWARLAPGFIASLPSRPRPLIVSAVAWVLGIALFAAGVPAGAWLMLAGFAALTSAVGLFAPSIARQRLAGPARLTRIGVRSAFVWAFIGLAILALESLGVATSYLQVSAARHAVALGFVTLSIYAVASRALPAFLGRQLWSARLQAVTLALANVAVAARVGPQVLGLGGSWSGLVVGLSGIAAYAALVLFAMNVLRTVRGPVTAARGPFVPIEVRFALPVPDRSGTFGPTR